MSELKITEEKWLLDEAGSAFVYALRKQGDINRMDFHIYGGYTETGEKTSPEELRANAEFVVEAHEVAQVTGLTPRQLAEQRDALLQACQYLVNVQDVRERGVASELLTMTHQARALEHARAAIANAEGARQPSACVWEPDFDGNWHTQCGNLFVFEADGPVGNKFGFCPYCGKELRQAEAEGE